MNSLLSKCGITSLSSWFWLQRPSNGSWFISHNILKSFNSHIEAIQFAVDSGNTFNWSTNSVTKLMIASFVLTLSQRFLVHARAVRFDLVEELASLFGSGLASLLGKSSWLRCQRLGNRSWFISHNVLQSIDGHIKAIQFAVNSIYTLDR